MKTENLESPDYPYFENDFVRVTLIDGILLVEYPDNLEITLPIAKQMVQDRLKFTKNGSYPMLGIPPNGLKIDRPSKAYFNSEDGIRGITACAFIVSNRIQRFFGVMWLKWEKPPIPFKLFVDKDEALNWLSTFKFLN